MVLIISDIRVNHNIILIFNPLNGMKLLLEISFLSRNECNTKNKE